VDWAKVRARRDKIYVALKQTFLLLGYFILIIHFQSCSERFLPAYILHFV